MRSTRHLLFCLCLIVIVFLYGEFNKVSSPSSVTVSSLKFFWLSEVERVLLLGTLMNDLKLT